MNAKYSMRRGFNIRRVYTFRRAYTLAELLISLAITAGLLMAMGSAFSTAGSAVEMNDRYFRSVQQARTAMDLVMTEIRHCTGSQGGITAPSVPVSTSTTTAITLTPGGQSGSPDFGGDSITFTYNNSSASTNPNTITLTDNVTSTVTVLASNVTNAVFTYMPGTNFATVPPTPCIASVSLTMTVQIGNNSITLNGSAAPRLNLVSLYQ